jgi:competence protein ComEC
MALLAACLAWLVGLGLALIAVAPADASARGPLLWALLALPALVGAAVARAYPLRLIALAAALLLLGWARGLSALPALAENPLEPYYGRIALRGTVAEPATPSDTSVTLRLAVASAARGDEPWEPGRGLVLLRLPRTAGYDYGDVLEARGTLRPPPDTAGSSYGATLRRQGVRGVMDYPETAIVGGGDLPQPQGTLYAIRRRLEASLAAALPEPHAGLLVGLLLGGSAALPPDFREAMRTVGLTHLVAVSGFNVSLVAAVLGALAGAVAGRRTGWPLAAVGIVLFTILVGAPMSAVRAAAMALVALSAEAVGRPRDGLAALALAAAVLVAWDPWLMLDLSFPQPHRVADSA